MPMPMPVPIPMRLYLRLRLRPTAYSLCSAAHYHCHFQAVLVDLCCNTISPLPFTFHPTFYTAAFFNCMPHASCQNYLFGIFLFTARINIANFQLFIKTLNPKLM